jgi:hypothetical protein
VNHAHRANCRAAQAGPLKPTTTIQVSSQHLEASATESDEVLRKMNTLKDGLSGTEASRGFKSPLGPAFGFAPLPVMYWPLLAATLLGYVLLTQVVKTGLFRMSWISE